MRLPEEMRGIIVQMCERLEVVVPSALDEWTADQLSACVDDLEAREAKRIDEIEAACAAQGEEIGVRLAHRRNRDESCEVFYATDTVAHESLWIADRGDPDCYFTYDSRREAIADAVEHGYVHRREFRDPIMWPRDPLCQHRFYFDLLQRHKRRQGSVLDEKQKTVQGRARLS